MSTSHFFARQQKLRGFKIIGFVETVERGGYRVVTRSLWRGGNSDHACYEFPAVPEKSMPPKCVPITRPGKRRPPL